MLLLSEEPKDLPNSETWETQVSPVVWDQGVPGWAKTAILVVINLKDPSCFPNQKQFSLGPKLNNLYLSSYNMDFWSQLILPVTPHFGQNFPSRTGLANNQRGSDTHTPSTP